jgi:hypothetical protein
MRFKLFIYLSISTLLFYGCSSIQNLDSPNYKQIRSQIFIGELGVYKKGIMEDDFQPIDNPNLIGPLRLSKNEVAFTRSGYKKYKMAFKKAKEEINDSLLDLNKPVYFELEIVDDVKFIESINQSGDGLLLDYLIQTEDNLAVTGVKMVFPDQINRKIQNASEIYLVDLTDLTYALKLIYSDSKSEIINFSEGDILGHTFSSICWSVNYKGDFLIGALPDKGARCPGKTKNKIRKLDEKDVFDEL